MKFPYWSIASLSHCQLCESYNDGSQPLQTFLHIDLLTYTYWLCRVLQTVNNRPNPSHYRSIQLEAIITHFTTHSAMPLVSGLNGRFGIRYSFVVWKACKPDRRPQWAFQASLRYALTSHVGEVCIVFKG